MDKKNRKTTDRDQQKNKSISKERVGVILAALLLVVVLLCLGAGILGKKSGREQSAAEADSSTAQAAAEEYLKVDEDFTGGYLIIGETPEEGLWATKVPGLRRATSEKVKSGRAYYAVRKGKYEGKIYYLLEDGMYLTGDGDDLFEVASYTVLSGYLEVTYISSGGVALRSWPDFAAENKAASAYVGDEISVAAKITLADETAVYLTEDGYYVAADNRYFNEYLSAEEDQPLEDVYGDLQK